MAYAYAANRDDCVTTLAVELCIYLKTKSPVSFFESLLVPYEMIEVNVVKVDPVLRCLSVCSVS